MSKLCAIDLVTNDFHRVKNDTPIPYCITNTTYVVFQSNEDFGVTGSRGDMPLGIFLSNEIQIQKGMIFADLLTPEPPMVIDANMNIEDVMRSLLLNSNKSIVIKDAVGKFAGIITISGFIASISKFLTDDGAGKNIFVRAIEQSHDPVMITNHEGIIQYINCAYETISGYARKEILGKKPNVLKSGRHDKQFYKHLWETISVGKPYNDRFINVKKDGSIYYVEKTISPVKNINGQITHYISTSKDISSRARYEEKLEFLAYYDPLTSLPNRLLFTEKLCQFIELALQKQEKLAVLFIDLDRFKIIIDTLGHDFGDELLCIIAKKLTHVLRINDTLARMGGDEFAIILKNVDSTDSILHLVRKFQNMFNETIEIKDHEISITASIGITIYPWDGENINMLFKHGDTALNLAKKLGGNGHQFYSKKMSVESEKRLKLETSMRKGIENKKEFFLNYQPQISLNSGEIIGVEALVRWNHPEYGVVSPLEFIPLAEETGLIEPLSELILREACVQTKKWNESGKCKIRTAINISGRQFKKPDFQDAFIASTSHSNIPLEYLEIEITESSLVGNDDHIIKTLEVLRSNGISIAIDDFGTGYSSLGYLKRLPIDILKIDRTFVRDITRDPDDASIVYAITTMAHNLGIKAIAEGVETKEQLAFLRACKCDYAQGYYLGRPMNSDDIVNYLQVFGMQSKINMRSKSLRATI